MDLNKEPRAALQDEVEGLLRALRADVPQPACCPSCGHWFTPPSPVVPPPEVVRLTLALRGYGKNPEECNPPDGSGACASHMAYNELTEFLKAEGYVYDDEKETYLRAVPPEHSKEVEELRQADAHVRDIITHEEAEEILVRFNASHWRSKRPDSEVARYSIPANPSRDDDLRLHAYIQQQRVKDARRLSQPAPASDKCICGLGDTAGWRHYDKCPRYTPPPPAGSTVVKDGEDFARILMDNPQMKCSGPPFLEGSREAEWNTHYRTARGFGKSHEEASAYAGGLLGTAVSRKAAPEDAGLVRIGWQYRFTDVQMGYRTRGWTHCTDEDAERIRAHKDDPVWQVYELREVYVREAASRLQELSRDR